MPYSEAINICLIRELNPSENVGHWRFGKKRPRKINYFNSMLHIPDSSYSSLINIFKMVL